MLQSKFLSLPLEYLCFKSKIYLFASNINTQFDQYAGFRQDLGATYMMHSVLIGQI